MRALRLLVLLTAAATIPVAGQVRPAAPACDRTCLEGVVDRYLEALLGESHARALESTASILRLFRRGEPLAILPDVFMR